MRQFRCIDLLVRFFFESIHEVVSAHELKKRGLKEERQVQISVEDGGLRFGEGFQADISIEEKVVLELRPVETLPDRHIKQIQMYLRLTGGKSVFL